MNLFNGIAQSGQTDVGDEIAVIAGRKDAGDLALHVEAAAEDQWWQSLLHVPGAGRERVEWPQGSGAGPVDRRLDLTEQLVVGERHRCSHRACHGWIGRA